ncbi:MAG: hypothetical protein IKR08_01345 [Firmicutes bacterium]|jgi:hypothetical protein|nr:hypothetical protein [Bacillota bacterium]
MDKETLFRLLEIDTPADLEYFEQLAELIESEEDIPFDLFYIALSGIKSDTALELLGNYFEELENSIPEGEDDLESLIDTVKQQLTDYAEDLENPDSRRDMARELYKFREWYHDAEGASVDGNECSVMEALYENRADGLLGGSHRFAFPGTEKYELGELTFRLGSFEKIDVVGDAEDGE